MHHLSSASAWREISWVRSALAVAALFALSSPAEGTLLMTASEVGSDVVISGSGSLDLTAWNFFGAFNPNSGLLSADSVVRIGAGPMSTYFLPLNFSGPSLIGPGTTHFIPSSNSGGPVGIGFDGTTPALFAPTGYTSGAALSASSTFSGETLASLGLAPGIYTWTWGSGPSADSLTLNVVPEPSTTALIGFALTGLAVWRGRARAA